MSKRGRAAHGCAPAGPTRGDHLCRSAWPCGFSSPSARLRGRPPRATPTTIALTNLRVYRLPADPRRADTGYYGLSDRADFKPGRRDNVTRNCIGDWAILGDDRPGFQVSHNTLVGTGVHHTDCSTTSGCQPSGSRSRTTSSADPLDGWVHYTPHADDTEQRAVLGRGRQQP